MSLPPAPSMSSACADPTMTSSPGRPDDRVGRERARLGRDHDRGDLAVARLGSLGGCRGEPERGDRQRGEGGQGRRTSHVVLRDGVGIGVRPVRRARTAAWLSSSVPRRADRPRSDAVGVPAPLVVGPRRRPRRGRRRPRAGHARHGVQPRPLPDAGDARRRGAPRAGSRRSSAACCRWTGCGCRGRCGARRATSRSASTPPSTRWSRRAAARTARTAGSPTTSGRPTAGSTASAGRTRSRRGATTGSPAGSTA